MSGGSARIVYEGRDYDGRVTGVSDVPFWVEESRRAKGRVLELGCGTGRVTIPVAAAGVDVVGLDSSESMLRRARRKAIEAGVEVEWVEGDMRSFELGGEFGLIYVPLATFGHMATEEDASKCLHRVRTHLAGGGRFAMDLFSAEFGGALSPGNVSAERDSSRLGLKVHSLGEIDELLGSAGMLRVETYGNYDRSEFSKSSPRLIVAAKVESANGDRQG